MLSISTREEFIRAIKYNNVVLIGYYDLDSEEGRFFSKVFSELYKHVDSRILVLRVDTSSGGELVDELLYKPCIRMYYMGKLVFEQHGFFGNLELDLFVLRRSIRSILREYNVYYKV